MVPDARAMTSRPTSVEPVKATLATSGCSTSRVPTTDPLPITTSSTPSGMPASSASSARRRAVSGVISAGLTTMVLPVARAGPDLPRGDGDGEVPRHDGGHHAEGLVEGHGPLRRPPGPWPRGACPPLRRRSRAPRPPCATSSRLSAMGLPTLAVSSWASSSPCSSTWAANRRISRARSDGATARQAGRRPAARATASSASSTPARELGDGLLGGRVDHGGRAAHDRAPARVGGAGAGPGRRRPVPRTAAGRRSPLGATAPRRRSGGRADSTASTTPSSLRAVTTRPGPDRSRRPGGGCTGPRCARRAAGAPCSPARSSPVSRRMPRAGAGGRGVPSGSGSCWTRSPPRRHVEHLHARGRWRAPGGRGEGPRAASRAPARRAPGWSRRCEGPARWP